MVFNDPAAMSNTPKQWCSAPPEAMFRRNPKRSTQLMPRFQKFSPATPDGDTPIPKNTIGGPTLLLRRLRKLRQSKDYAVAISQVVFQRSQAPIYACSAPVKRLSGDPASRRSLVMMMPCRPLFKVMLHAAWFLELTLEASHAVMLVGRACPSNA